MLAIEDPRLPARREIVSDVERYYLVDIPSGANLTLGARA